MKWKLEGLEVKVIGLGWGVGGGSFPCMPPPPPPPPPHIPSGGVKRGGGGGGAHEVEAG